MRISRAVIWATKNSYKVYTVVVRSVDDKFGKEIDC